MELNRQNYINTTSMLTLSDETASGKFLFLNDLRFEYSTTLFADDDTAASITVSFDATTTIDRIAIVNHNLKDFTLFYDGSTANALALTSGDTTAADYSSNSETSHYFRFTSIDVTSVTLDMKKTIVADQNKHIGYYVISENRTDFDGRVPIAQSYLPRLDTKSVDHALSDGTIRTQTLEDNWRATMSFDFVTEATRNTLKDVYDDHISLIFAPFGTTTAWDGVIFPCNWVGPFEFYQFSDNAAAAGFSGSINLMETSSL